MSDSKYDVCGLGLYGMVAEGVPVKFLRLCLCIVSVCGLYGPMSEDGPVCAAHRAEQKHYLVLHTQQHTLLHIPSWDTWP